MAGATFTTLELCALRERGTELELEVDAAFKDVAEDRVGVVCLLAEVAQLAREDFRACVVACEITENDLTPKSSVGQET